MANRFDVVPVRTKDERRIVVGVVLRPQTGRAIVLAPCPQGRAMESVDLLTISSPERHVKMGRLLFPGSADAQ